MELLLVYLSRYLHWSYYASMPSYRFLSLRFCWVLLSLLPSTAAAQLLVGTIVNSATQQPIPFVNVGLPKRGLGTVSDEQGHYQLRYNPAYAADSVRVSSIGYEPRMISFAALLTQVAEQCGHKKNLFGVNRLDV